MMLKIRNLLTIFFSGFVFTSTSGVHACTIFMANDGRHVWIGNNEDELQNVRYRMWFYPPAPKRYGYAIWTELSFGKLLNGFSYLNPQGGLNEFGLFMDFTTIDKITVVHDDQKKDRKKEVVTDILKTCKTVEEALQYINRYNLVKINSSQLFIADASGNYATITGGYVVHKTDNSFALTNYCINNGHKEACHRRDVVTHYLNASTTFQLSDITTMLEKSTQKLPNNLISNYSMAVDLKTSTIYLYYKNDFTTVSVLNLSTELGKGKHHRNIQEYFPRSITSRLEKTLGKNGIDSTVGLYNRLRKASSVKYNFTNDDVLNLGIRWIDRGKTMEAMRLLECMKEFDSTNTTISCWLGVCNRKLGNMEKSNSYFAKVLALKPDDYLATLWGKQQNGRVTFRLADFEDAEQVSLMGDFTDWTKKPIKMKKENGYWTCAVDLPKGDIIYKFIVNGQYLADSKNYMHVGTGPDVFSKVYVW